MAKILELDITLAESEPKIWRRVQAKDDMSFHELHYLIQFTMGWSNSHLHQFQAPPLGFVGIPDPEDWTPMKDSRKIRINKALQNVGDSVAYEYDFGDSWIHRIEVKKILEEEQAGQFYPVCIDGKNACPPEDSGGVWGYADMLEALKDPGSDAYEDIQEWIGEGFDPTAFNKDQVNKTLKNFKKEVRAWDDMAGW